VPDESLGAVNGIGEVMTDAELSLKIAEFLEPKPGESPIVDREGKLSSKQVWIYVVHHHPGCEGCGWRPRNMVNDPAMTILLMKRPDFVRVQLFMDSFTKANMYFAEFKDPIRQCEHKYLGRAVAEAFARAKGLL